MTFASFRPRDGQPLYGFVGAEITAPAEVERVGLLRNTIVQEGA